MSISTISPFKSDDERKLNDFDLTTEILHDGLRPGASRAANRSTLALDTSAGTDIYHDGMENLHRILQPLQWKLVPVDQQPRFIHPQGIVSFTISSGINVGTTQMRTPRTRRKGKSTRNSLAPRQLPPSLFDDLEAQEVVRINQAASTAPLYFLLYERVSQGRDGLSLEFASPASMTRSGRVNDWSDRIGVPFLSLAGDLSDFDTPDEGDEIDVPVEPR